MLINKLAPSFRISFGFLAFVALSTPLGFAAEVDSGTVFKVDPAASRVEWVGKKVTGAHDGEVKLSSGSAIVKEGKLVGGAFAVDMNSIAVHDIENPKDNTKLANHLKSDDFFSSASFGESTFKITQATPIAGAKAGEPNYNIAGDLSIKGIVSSISFPAVVEIKEDSAQATAKVTVDRTKFNIRYGSGKFFESLGDKLIYDEFELALNLVAKAS